MVSTLRAAVLPPRRLRRGYVALVGRLTPAMHNRRRRKREERDRRLSRVFAQVLPGLTELALRRTDVAPLKLDWDQLPAALDPGRNGKAGYALPQARAERKRAQVARGPLSPTCGGRLSAAEVRQREA